MGKKLCKPLRSVSMLEAIRKMKISDKPVMVQFKADWCGACSAATPEIQKASCVLEDDMEVIQVDIEQNALIASEFEVQNLPTVMVVQQGQVLSKMEGAGKARDYTKMGREWIQKHGS